MADVSAPAIFRPYPLPPPPPDHYYVEPPDPKAASSECLVAIEQSDPFDSYTYRLKRVLYQGSTTYQNVLIAETFNYGLALFLDGVIQSASDDEALYHELLVQPAMLRHPEPRDVLILGGGEGAALREVVAHRSVRSVTMVDLDRELVELCRTHLLPFHRGAFEDPRVRLVFADGRPFVENDDGFYDVAVVDLVDLLDSGLADALYTRQFYQQLRRRLRPDAIVAVQGLEFSFLDDKAHAALARTLRTVFAEVYSYRAHIPSFLAGWGFVVASDWFRPQDWMPADIDRMIEQRLGHWLDHVNGDFLRGAFAHCRETLFALSQPGPILEDGIPYIPPPNIEEIEPTVTRFPVL
jgi:spermidine synthase